MKMITSLEEYKELVKTARDQGCIVSNCFFLPNTIRDLTEKGKLFVRKIDAGLLLLEEADEFYRVRYYLRPGQIPEEQKFDKDCVIELPFQNEFTPSQRMQEEQISGMGFSLGRNSALMSISSDNLKISVTVPFMDKISFALEEDHENIYHLLKECFDPLYAFLPDEAELMGKIRCKQVWILKSAGQIAAVLNSSMEKNTAMISHVAVASEFRGKGYGKMIVEVYHRYYKERVRTFSHWVDLSNSHAINMYRVFGYQFIGRRANEYVFKINS